jgi:CelD/BcsL family acetyltransferase involved in cellulose biosynthesis
VSAGVDPAADDSSRNAFAGPTTSELELSELELGAHDDEWGALAAETGNVFGTPEWISTWWRHFGAGRRLLVTACRSADGELVAVLPLYQWSGRPLRVARFIGHGPGDALGPVCRSEDRAAAAFALERALEDWGVSLLVSENVPAEEGWSGLLGGRVVEREASPVLALNGLSWESLLASWSKNLRSQVRSRERKLAGDHRIDFRLADDPDRLEQDLDTLYALHRARWPHGSGFGDAEPFHRSFAALALARGWFRLWLLEIDGEAHAAWYGFRFANVESYYQAGRRTDPAWERYRLGFVLLVHSIREAAADGALEYRFLRGDEDFKYRFASHDHGLETFVRARGFAAKAALRVALSLPRPLRRRLKRT